MNCFKGISKAGKPIFCFQVEFEESVALEFDADVLKIQHVTYEQLAYDPASRLYLHYWMRERDLTIPIDDSLIALGRGSREQTTLAKEPL